jgi:hypothetical protein
MGLLKWEDGFEAERRRGSRCSRCRAQLAEPDGACPECGWRPASYLGYLVDCTILGGDGLGLCTGELVDVYFRDRTATIDRIDDESVTIPYSEVTAFEFGGPGTRQTGGGFVGGGFGLKGAAEGMLIASVMNRLTRRTRTDTVICIQTRKSEVFLHATSLTPAAARLQLSPVVTRLRGLSAERGGFEAALPDHAPVQRLTELGAMLKEGLIDRSEFDQLKRELLGSGDGSPYLP